MLLFDVSVHPPAQKYSWQAVVQVCFVMNIIVVDLAQSQKSSFPYQTCFHYSLLPFSLLFVCMFLYLYRPQESTSASAQSRQYRGAFFVSCTDHTINI